MRGAALYALSSLHYGANVKSTHFSSLAIAGLFAFGMQHDAYSAPPTDSLVAHYKFDDNLLDSSGSGLHASGSNFSFESGVLGKAVNFSTSGAATAQPPISASTSFAIAAWVSATQAQPSGVMVIADERNRNGNGVCNSSLVPYQVGCTNFQLNVYEGRFAFEIATRQNVNAPTDQTRIFSDKPILLNQFYSIVGNYDSATGEASLWIDGVKEATASVGSVLNIQFDSVLHIGRSTAVTDQGWKGAIDDLRFYSRSLTESEIGQVSTVPEPTSYAMLLGGLLAIGAANFRRIILRRI